MASECAPFAKAGGLGDVVGSLPKALRVLGHDVRVVIPLYGGGDRSEAQRHATPLAVPLGAGEAWCAVWEDRLPGTDVPVYFLEHNALFGGANIYSDDRGSHGAARFIFLSRGAFMLCRQLGFVPDIMHTHDWPTAWLPAMLNTVERGPPFERTASILTIHNIAHQPRFGVPALGLAHLPAEVYRSDGLEDFKHLNPLKGGLYHATMVTTVSPRYAWEIRTPEGGAGLHPVIDFRGGDLVGILNGIDDRVWNPATDPMIAANYGPFDLSGKAVCKRALQETMGLDPRPDVPLLGVVSRLTTQKGSDVIAHALDGLLGLGAQVVLLGSGDPGLEALFRHRAQYGGGWFAARIGYDEALAHQIEAGADLFLMPSRFEPCGLNQLYSQRYGTPPIVRATGGLDDTVEQCDVATQGGTGFKLWELSVDALVNTAGWAVTVYRDHPDVFRAVQKRGMTKRMGWDQAALRYGEVYAWAVERVGGLAESAA